MKQEHDVVMIATENKSTILLNSLNKRLLHDTDGSLKERILPIYGSPQHLYITSDEEIKGEDYCLVEFNKIWKCISFLNGRREYETLSGEPCFYSEDKSFRKIIATTNPELQLDYLMSRKTFTSRPVIGIIDQSFIELYIKAYNTGNPITKVMVEYRYNTHIEFEDNKKEWKDLPQLNSDGSIIISLKEEKMYTLQDMYAEGREALRMGLTIRQGQLNCTDDPRSAREQYDEYFDKNIRNIKK